MYEIDFLPVGDEGQSGDAIAIRFTRPDTGQLAHVIIDAGFQTDGDALVRYVRTYFSTTRVELAILTHPDADHIGRMGTVLRGLDVGVLCVHDIRAHGGGSLRAAEAVDELMALARRRGTSIHEPFTGDSAFGGALTILGPTREWYDALVAEQVAEAPARASSAIRGTAPAGVRMLARGHIPIEVPFDDDGGTNPRNNTSVITWLALGTYRALLTGDAGVPALEQAWDFLEATGGASPPPLVHVPHAGSRHNASSELLNRIVGPPGQVANGSKEAQVSVASRSVRHPSARVANAYMRRGYKVFETRGKTIHYASPDAPARDGWVPAIPLEPMDEGLEEAA